MTENNGENSGRRSGLSSDDGVQTTVEEQRESSNRPKIERYLAEHIQLSRKTEDSSVGSLQRALNEGARHSWSLVGVSQDPKGQGGILLIWDTSGFISG